MFFIHTVYTKLNTELLKVPNWFKVHINYPWIHPKQS